MDLAARLHHSAPLPMWVAWLCIGIVVAFGLATVIAIWMAASVTKGSYSPRQSDPDDDAIPSYRQVWEQLPPHIQESFHPEWPWLAPPALTQREPGRGLADEIRNLETGDPEFLGI